MRKLGSRYVLHEMLGQGTAGQVWRGAHVPDGTPVAIKVLRPELADDPEIVDRFLREWDLLVELDSPDLVRVRDLINEPDTLAIVMDLVEGIDLRAHLDQNGPRPVSEAVRLVVGVLWALDSVHAAGIIHRDVKPENVLIDTADPRRPFVRLTDFGVARMVHTPARAAMTGPIGTPLYMAPELTTDAPPTPSVDIYAAGVVLYELLAGSPPFDEAHPADMVRAHREDQPLPIQGVPATVWDVLSAMLAKSPRQRPASAAEAAEDLLDAIEGARDSDRAHDGGRERDVAFDAAHTQVGRVGDFPGWDNEATSVGPVIRADERDRQSAHATQRLAGAAAAAGGAGAAGGWNDAEHTQIAGIPPVRSDWDDAQHTGVAGGADWGDADTGGQPAVRVPARSSGTASDRNTVISAIPANRQPSPGSGGAPSGPSVRAGADRRRRTRIAAGAGLVVALVAGAGGWALAAAGESDTSLTADGGALVSADPSATATLPGGVPMPPGMNPADVPTAPGTTTRPSGSTGPSPGQTVAPGATTPADAGQTTAPPDAGAPPAATTEPPAKDGTVPNVVGQSKNAATNTLQGKGFTNVATNEICQKGQNGGLVIDQGPNAGSVVPLSTKITLTVQATNCVEVPAVSGTVAAAKNAITAAGLNPLDGSCQGNNVPTGAVAGTNPAAGTMMRKGDGVWVEPKCEAPASTKPAAK